MSISVDPMDMQITAALMRANGYAPIIGGDDWNGRIQVRDAAGAVSLEDAVIVFTARETPTAAVALLTRSSATDIAGSAPARRQIEIDADQDEEDTATETGKGWFTLRFGRETADKALVDAAVGLKHFDIRIRFADGSITTFMRGRVEFVKAISAQP